MKIKGRKTPFWAFRYESRKGRVPFSIYRVTEASTSGIKTDKRIGSLYYGLSSVSNTKDTFSYTTFVKNFHDINELSNDHKRKMLITLLESYKWNWKNSLV